MRKVSLGSLVNIRTGKLDANASNPEGKYPFFTCSRETLKIDTYSYDCECVLVAGNGDLNVKYYNGKFDAYQRTYIIESIDKNILNVKYLYYFMQLYVSKLRQMSIGGVIKYIKLNYLTDAKIPLPNIEKQNKIVKVLEKAQELIDKRKAQIEALDQLTQSVFLEMFGDPVTNKTWERRPLKDIADVRDGTHDSPKYVPNGYPLVTSKNIKNGKIDLSNVNYISEEDFININKRSKVDVGDIIMPMIGTIGNPIIVDEQPNFAIKNVALIKFNNPLVVNIYLKYLLDSHYLDYILNKNKRGGTQKFLSLTDIRNMEIPLPPRDLQDKFSEIVKKIDSQKSILHKSLRELEKNFNSLMQRAFKGELFND